MGRLLDLPQKTRRRIYQVASAVVPLLVAYGLLAEGEAPLWLGLAGALLATGESAMAARHTPKDEAPR